jgi:hypothetical protein
MSEITAEFVRGWAARACQVDTSMNELVMTSSDGPLLKDIAIFLRTSRIACTVSPLGDRYRLRIRGLEPLKKWREVVGFTDIARSQKIDLIITSLEPKGNG